MVSRAAVEETYMRVVDNIYRALVNDDELPSVNKWPKWWKDILLDPNKGHSDTYRVFCFLVRNGVTPQKAAKYIEWWADEEVLCAKPDSLRNHVKSMIKEWQSGDPMKLFNFYIVSVMDLEIGKPWGWKGSKTEFAIWWASNKAPNPTEALDALIEAAEENAENEDDKTLALLMDRAIEAHEEEKAAEAKRMSREEAEEAKRKRRKRITDAAREKWSNKA